MNLKSRRFKAAMQAMVDESRDPQQAILLVEGILALVEVQPPVTALEAQALCAVLWRFTPGPNERSHCSRLLARLIIDELNRVEELLSDRPLPSQARIQHIRCFGRRLRKMDEPQSLSLYIAAYLFKHAPSGSRMDHFFVLRD